MTKQEASQPLTLEQEQEINYIYEQMAGIVNKAENKPMVASVLTTLLAEMTIAYPQEITLELLFMSIKRQQVRIAERFIAEQKAREKQDADNAASAGNL